MLPHALGAAMLAAWLTLRWLRRRACRESEEHGLKELVTQRDVLRAKLGAINRKIKAAESSCQQCFECDSEAVRQADMRKHRPTARPSPDARYKLRLAAASRAKGQGVDPSAKGGDVVPSKEPAKEHRAAEEPLERVLFSRLRKQRPRPPDKEVREAMAFFRKVRNLLGPRRLVVDVCGGHGMLGALFVCYGKARKCVVIDKLEPRSYQSMRAAWAEKLQGDEGDEVPVVRFVAADFRDALPTLLDVEAGDGRESEVAVVACHACSHLTDCVLSICIERRVDFAVCFLATSRLRTKHCPNQPFTGVHPHLLSSGLPVLPPRRRDTGPDGASRESARREPARGHRCRAARQHPRSRIRLSLANHRCYHHPGESHTGGPRTPLAGGGSRATARAAHGRGQVQCDVQQRRVWARE